MRKTGVWLGVLATAMIAGSASASVTYQGVGGFNFFTYNGVLNTSTWDHNQVSGLGANVQTSFLHFQQPPGDVGVPNPIPAGQIADNYFTHNETGGNYDGGDALSTDNHYDVEQLFWAYDSTTNILNVGMVTGFNSAGYGGFLAGDFFIAPGALASGNANTSSYAYAVGTGDDRLGVTRQNSPPWTATESQYFDVEADPYRVTDGQVVNGLASVDWTQGTDWNSIAGGNGNIHNFLAVQFDFTGNSTFLDILEGPNGGSYSMHWTMGCGNDAAHQVVTVVPPNTPVVPVPAAAPLAMLGMAIVGIVRRKRQSKV